MEKNIGNDFQEVGLPEPDTELFRGLFSLPTGKPNELLVTIYIDTKAGTTTVAGNVGSRATVKEILEETLRNIYEQDLLHSASPTTHIAQ